MTTGLKISAVLLAFTMLGTSALGQDSSVPFPDIPRGIGESCVADTDFMRLNHMDLLRHTRDLTMREGMRETDYSLAECISCHAVNGPDATPVTIESEQHFCRACHDYAAVKVDCFQCHNSVPEVADQAALIGDFHGSADALDAYLEGISQ